MKKVYIEVMGCQMNKSDAERMYGMLEHLGYTDMDNVSDFGERTWGEKLQGTTLSVPLQIAEMYKFDEKVKNATIIDGMTPRSYLFEFEGDDGKLAVALDRWNDDLLRAYYAKSNE